MFPLRRSSINSDPDGLYLPTVILSMRYNNVQNRIEISNFVALFEKNTPNGSFFDSKNAPLIIKKSGGATLANESRQFAKNHSYVLVSAVNTVVATM